MYQCQGKQNQNDKYKSQNCRAFYREKFCFYGKRCHFRHEYRSFTKIHRHYYMAHLCALRHNHCEILAESRNLPDGGSSSVCDEVQADQRQDKYASRQFSDLSTDSASEEDEFFTAETSPGEGLGRRLAIF